MKQSYNIEIAGVKLNIMSDDDAKFVQSTVDELESAVQKMLRIGTNYSKLDALILCALDYLGELSKAEAKIKNLEAQIAVLEAGRHIRGEADSDVAPTVAPKAKKAEKETPKAEAKAESEKKAESAGESSSRDEKFRQLEALLGSQLKIDLDNN